MKRFVLVLTAVVLILTAMQLCVCAEDVNKDFCIYMQTIDGMEFVTGIDGVLYGFEEKDGMTAAIGKLASPPSEMAEMMSPFVSENESVFYFIIAAYDIILGNEYGRKNSRG